MSLWRTSERGFKRGQFVTFHCLTRVDLGSFWAFVLCLFGLFVLFVLGLVFCLFLGPTVSRSLF